VLGGLEGRARPELARGVRVSALSTGLLVLAYVLAVVDGTLQDKGLYPSTPGRMGWGYVRKHPWIVAGAGCGIAGTVLAVLAD
jgi:hypothetical protein